MYQRGLAFAEAARIQWAQCDDAVFEAFRSFGLEFWKAWPNMPEQVSYGGWDNMPAYATALNDAQIAAVSNYVRGSWGNRGAAVTAASVHAQR